MAKTATAVVSRKRRQASIRKKIRGTGDRPRLSVFRSSNHIYAQLIDDESGTTLASASTISKELASHEGHRGNMVAAAAVGSLLAEKAKAVSVELVVFDRNGFLFHGRVKALADAARKGGLKF
jgi:large subunit ribosomal protein L18